MTQYTTRGRDGSLMVLQEDSLHPTIPTCHCCPVILSCGDAVLQDTVTAQLWGAVPHLCPFYLTMWLRSAWYSQDQWTVQNQLSSLTVVCRTRGREAVFWKMQIWNLRKARAIFLRTQRHPAYRRKQMGWALKKKGHVEWPMGDTYWQPCRLSRLNFWVHLLIDGPKTGSRLWKVS